MIEKKITFENYNGETVTETFAFHMSKADIADFTFSGDGSDIVDSLAKVVETEDVKKIFEILKALAMASVGRKNEAGTRFIKDDEARSALFDTDAYSELLMELLQVEDAAADFIKGILPKDLSEKIESSTEGELKDLSKEELLKRFRDLNDNKKTGDDLHPSIEE